MRGTAWQATDVGEMTVAPDLAPRLELEDRDPLVAAAFTGCQGLIGLEMTGGSVKVSDVELHPASCVGEGAPVERAFIEILIAATRYESSGDVLVIGGPSGAIRFVRQVPPIGDPARAAFDALRAGRWTIVAATGIEGRPDLPPVRFLDQSLSAGGDCGFGGRIRFLAGGRVEVDEEGIYWDTVAGPPCGDRGVVARLLTEAERFAVDPTGRVVFAGPAGEVAFEQ